MKTLYVPGRIWTNINSFLRDFPNLKFALFMLHAPTSPITTERNAIRQWCNCLREDERESESICHSSGSGSYTNLVFFEKPHRRTIGLGPSCGKFNPVPLCIDRWTYDRKMNTYRDMIRFAITPEYPIEYNLSIKSRCNISSDTVTSIYGDTAKTVDKIKQWYLTDGCKRKCRTKAGLCGGRKDELMARAKRKENSIINKFISCIEYFRASTPAEYKKFKEIYGKYTSVDQVPANTIAYTVVGEPPPVGKTNPSWDTVDFWSAVWGSKWGMAILNAVAYNMPVKVTTKVTNWKDPKAPPIRKIQKDNLTKIFIPYIFQDFEIEVGKKNNILIKYNKGRASAIIEKRKKSAWKKFLPMIGVFIIAAAAMAIAAAAAASAAAASGTAAGTAASGTAAGTTFTTTTLTEAFQASGGLSATSAATSGGLVSIPTTAGSVLVPKGGVSLSLGQVATKVGLTGVPKLVSGLKGGTVAGTATKIAETTGKSPILSAIKEAAPGVIKGGLSYYIKKKQQQQAIKLQREMLAMQSQSGIGTIADFTKGLPEISIPSKEVKLPAPVKKKETSPLLIAGIIGAAVIGAMTLTS